MELINWIDKPLSEVKRTKEFNEYFFEIEIETIEDEKYMFNPEKGIDIVMNKTTNIHTIHLFSGRTSESKRYAGEIVFNLNFEMKQSDIFKALGKPNRYGQEHKDIFGTVPAWDKYYYDSYSLHLQYNSTNERIDLITLSSLTLEPYLNSSLQ